MASKDIDPENKKIDADVVVGGLEIELKAKHVADINREIETHRRVVRQGSKAQWYCTADPDDQRVQAFASFLRSWRMNSHRSQTEAAAECGMTQPQWSSLESGSIEPLPKKVFEIERAFGMDPGDLSFFLGYGPRGGDDRELFTQVAEKLDRLYIHGAWAVEEVMERDTNAIEVQKFLEDVEKVGLDVIAALTTVCDNLYRTMNFAVQHAMPKVFRMKQSEMYNLKRIISLNSQLDNGTDEDAPF